MLSIIRPFITSLLGVRPVRQIGLLLVLSCPLAANATEMSISVKPEFSTGTYGTDTRTRLLETPLELRMHEGTSGIGIRLPYTIEDGNQQILPGFGPIGSASSQSFRRQGLGNIRLSAWTRLWEHASTGTTLGATVKLSPPAIRHIQPLGAGFTRVSLELDLSIPLPHRFTLDLTLGRRFVVGAPGLGLSDYWYGTIDIGHDLSDRWSVGVTVDTQGASSRTGTAALEIGPWVQVSVAPGWRIGAYLFRGFTRDSADWGGGFTLTYRFAI